MSGGPYMPLYVGDYLRDTMHLSTEEHGAYLLILMTLWSRGGSLPADAETLAQAARLAPRRWAAAGPKVLALLTVEGGQVTQKRLAAELTKDATIRAKRKEAGELGVIARRLNRRGEARGQPFGPPGGAPPGPARGHANGQPKDQPVVKHPDQKENPTGAGDSPPSGGSRSPSMGPTARRALTPAERAANLEAAISRNRAARVEAGSPDIKAGTPDGDASADDERR